MSLFSKVQYKETIRTPPVNPPILTTFLQEDYKTPLLVEVKNKEDQGNGFMVKSSKSMVNTTNLTLVLLFEVQTNKQQGNSDRTQKSLK